MRGAVRQRQTWICFLAGLGVYWLAQWLHTGEPFAQSHWPYYVYYAQALLDGRLDFGALPPAALDLAVYQGRTYLYHPPFPALLMAPLVALGGLGVGTGFALASKLVHPVKEVLCYYGDGSFGMTAFDMETANRFGAPYIAVIGNNSAMNQIRYGQLAKYGEERGNVGNKLGDVPFSKFAEMLGGYGEEVREAGEIAKALQRARESVARSGRSAVVNIWVDPREWAPGTKNQTMYK